MKAVHLKVYGRVQGVFFRKHTKEKADALGVTGNVRNCSDGSVEIFAEGDPQVLGEFVNWCHSGPSRARVDRLDINEHPLKNYSGFLIIH